MKSKKTIIKNNLMTMILLYMEIKVHPKIINTTPLVANKLSVKYKKRLTKTTIKIKHLNSEYRQKIVFQVN
jgi:hypothetical protein